jgi:dihydroneopterin aldolase
LSATVPFARSTPGDTRPAITALRVFVRGLAIRAEIGVHPHEYGRGQPLLIDVELDIDPAHCEHIADTVNYETIVAKARAVAAEGHCKLVEAFTERLAEACMADTRVSRVRVRVEKPEALAPDAAAAGVEIVMTRA